MPQVYTPKHGRKPKAVNPDWACPFEIGRAGESFCPAPVGLCEARESEKPSSGHGSSKLPKKGQRE